MKDDDEVARLCGREDCDIPAVREGEPVLSLSKSLSLLKGVRVRPILPYLEERRRSRLGDSGELDICAGFSCGMVSGLGEKATEVRSMLGACEQSKPALMLR